LSTSTSAPGVRVAFRPASSSGFNRTTNFGTYVAAAGPARNTAGAPATSAKPNCGTRLRNIAHLPWRWRSIPVSAREASSTGGRNCALVGRPHAGLLPTSSIVRSWTEPVFDNDKMARSALEPRILDRAPAATAG